MANITLGGSPIQTSGNLPPIGSKAPNFSLILASLEAVTLDTYPNKKKILNIVPSLDTSVCLASAVTFQDSLPEDSVIITISRDTPFALDRVCKGELKIATAVLASDMSRAFGEDYQCEIISGPLVHFLSRAIIVLDKDNIVRYIEQVPEIKQEPDYTNALASINNI